MADVASAPAQSTGLPPVEDEDIKPQSDQDEGGSKGSKTAERDGSQPREDSGAKEKGPGPWTEKLAAAGLDDPAFDEFIRSEIQPYITQLEQGGAGGSSEMWQGDAELEQAAYDLVNELRTNPEQAYAELGELLGIATSDGMDEMGMEDEGAEFDDSDEAYDDDEPDDPRLNYVQQLMQKEQEQREDAQLEEFLSKLSERVPNFDPELYVQCLISADDNLDAAWTAYMKFHQKFGLDSKQPPEAPNVLGENDGGTPPPSTPEYKSIGDAMDAFMAEDRARKTRR